MEELKDLLAAKAHQIEDSKNTIKILGADVGTTKGYTQVPNFVLQNPKLSIGAKITYAMLLKYAWYDDHCFPGQERLAKDIGTTDRSVRRYLGELEKSQFVKITQRGLGKVNIYELNFRVKKHR